VFQKRSILNSYIIAVFTFTFQSIIKSLDGEDDIGIVLIHDSLRFLGL
jgi:hypothetical protein